MALHNANLSEVIGRVSFDQQRQTKVSGSKMQDTEAGEVTKAKKGQIIAENGNKQYVKPKMQKNQPAIHLFSHGAEVYPSCERGKIHSGKVISQSQG